SELADREDAPVARTPIPVQRAAVGLMVVVTRWRGAGVTGPGGGGHDGSLPKGPAAFYSFGCGRISTSAESGDGAMALRLEFGADDLLRCRFAVSPLCETHEAVRTLARPERHGYHLPWLRRMRSAIA